MARNVEIKARLRDPTAARARATRLSAGPPVLLEQEDTFFFTPDGRLKLRVFPDGHGELIFYRRPDAVGAKTSEYEIHQCADPKPLKNLLAAALGIRGVVRKRRLLYLAGSTRIHLDEVEGLGAFLELEVVLTEGQPARDGERIADEWLEELGVAPSDRIASAYIDLLEARHAP